MRLSKAAAVVLFLLLSIPLPALPGSCVIFSGGPLQGAPAGKFSQRAHDDAGWTDGLPGVELSRERGLWVDGFPLIVMGYLKVTDSLMLVDVSSGAGTGGEGGASGRAMELKQVGVHCRVYVDTGCKPYPSDSALQALTSEFDDRIWPNDTAVFGTIVYQSIDINVINIDGPYGIGGYFNPGSPGAVQIDCADLSSWGYQILAHEFQHLIHNQKDPDEELWVNEGCADVAIAICYGINDGTLSGHISAFEGTPDNDLTVFQNQIYDYGSVYAFTQYVWDHFGGRETIRNLVAEKGNGIAGINNVLAAGGWLGRFETLFPDWAIANRINRDDVAGGQYGYDGLRIAVQLSSDWSTLPIYSGANVQRWASDCYRFRGGDGQDLEVTFCATQNSFAPRLYGLGTTGINSTVINLTMDPGPAWEAVLRSFGTDYTEAILFTPSSATGDYSYTARLVDRTPPRTTIGLAPSSPDGNAGWYITRPNITLSVSESGTIWYRWDDLPEEEYTGPVPAAEGNHTFWYGAVDVTLNRETNRSLVIKVDTEAPEAVLTTTPERPDGASEWFITAPVIEFTTEPGAVICYRWENETFRNFTASITAPYGANTLEYFARDEAGNDGATYSRTFRVDATPPEVWAEVSPPSPDGSGGWYRTVPTITLGASEPGATILYSWDNSSEMSFIRPLKPQQGVHELVFRARDIAGNNATRQELTLRVDSESPVVTITVDPRSPEKKDWYRTRPSITLTVQDADPSAAALFAWDDEQFRNYAGPVKAQDGVHTFRYYAKDSRGNTANESNRVFRVDSKPPVTAFTVSIAPDGEWYRSLPKITLSSDENADIYYCWDEGAPVLYSGPLSGPEGEHKITFFSKDAAGNTEKSRTMSFRVDTAAPVAQFSPSATSIIAGETVLFDASTSADRNGIEQYSFDFGDGSRKTGPSDREEHYFEAAGTYAVTLKVKDASGLWSEPVTVTVMVTLPRQPPKASGDGTVFSLSGAHIALISFVAVALVAGVALYGRRRGLNASSERPGRRQEGDEDVVDIVEVEAIEVSPEQ